MLSAVRSSVLRCAPRLVRPIGTASSGDSQNTQDALYREATSFLGVEPPKQQQSSSSSSSHPTPSSSSLTSTTSPLSISSATPAAMIPREVLEKVVDASNIPPEQDPLLAYLTTRILQRGHKARARRIVSRTLLHIHALTRAPALPVVRQAIERAAPAVRIVSHKIGGKIVMRPTALNEKQRVARAVEEILKSAKTKQGHTLEERLAREFISIVSAERPDQNAVLKKKEDLHKSAMVNRGNMRG